MWDHCGTTIKQGEIMRKKSLATSAARGKMVRVKDLERNEDRQGHVGGRRRPIFMDNNDIGFRDAETAEGGPVDLPEDRRDLTQIFG